MITETSTITEEVQRLGWCRVGPMSDGEYRALVHELGTPKCETAVELRPDVRSYLCKPEPVPFHTDHPEADWMSWRCEMQDEADGSQQLVDGLEALRACGPRIRDALMCIHAEVRVRQDMPPSRIPIVRPTPQGDRLFFASWIKPIESDLGSLDAFAALRDSINRRSESVVLEVRLKEGEVLIIDNGRQLHGRKGLSGASKRRLRRFWIARESVTAG